MIAKVYLDASFVIALLVDNHPFNVQARQKLHKLVKTEVCISLFVIDEVIFNLKKYGFEKSEIQVFIEKYILSLANLSVLGIGGDRELLQDYLDLWVSTPLRPTDAVHLLVMRDSLVNVIATFDQHFIDNQKALGIKVL